MKKGIHPQYYPDAKITCACGNKFTAGSTRPVIHVGVCHKCHPFYTGQQKFVDNVDRIERFRQKQTAAAAVTRVKKEKLRRKAEEAPKTLKEMLGKT